MVFGSNVNEYYVDKAREAMGRRAKALARIRTRRDAEEYVSKVRRRVGQIFSFPPRTPLNPVVTATEDKGGHVVEKLYYFSRPGYPVTANFCLPKRRRGRVPGVLIVCGHSGIGKACDTYASAALGLVSKGFAVLIIDPIEQGERRQYRDLAATFGRVGAPHNMMGKQLALEGEWLGSWRTWDAIRGLDYLETRPEVDPSRLLVTGNSGGGTLTTWVAATDPRPIAVAPSCYVTSWLRNIENELIADIEQMPPRILAFSLDMGDLLLAQAPRDIMILGQENDYFDPRGVRATFEEVRRINSLLGGRTEIFLGPTDHGFSVHNRQAVYGFFLKAAGMSGTAREPKIVPPADQETWAAGGSVSNIAGDRRVWELIADKAEALAQARKPLSSDALRRRLGTLLAVGKPFAPHFRVLRNIKRDGFGAARFGLETEPGRIMAVLLQHSPDRELFHIDTASREATLLIPDEDGFAELKARRAKARGAVFALDVRTIGEMMPSGTDLPEERDLRAPCHFDYHYAALGTMFGEPVVGGKVKDILCAIELLAACGAKKIHLEGNGLGAIPALFAAVLSGKVATLRLTNAPESYTAECRKPVTPLPLSCIVPGILKEMDLPDIRRWLGRTLTVIETHR